MAEALRGRGDRLGANLAATGEYFGEINTVLPELQADISGLADFADTYNGAADDLLAVLDNLAITNATIVDQQEQLRRTFTVGASSANELAGFLETNERNLISLAETSRPVLGLFAEYSPVYPCLLEGLTRSVPRIGETFGDGRRPGAEPQHPGLLPAAEPLRAGRPARLPRQDGARLHGAGQHRRGDRPGAGRRVLLPVPAERRHRVRRERGAPGAGLLPRTARTTGATTREPPRTTGNALPSGLAGSTAELDFVRSILGYQTGAGPGTSPTCRRRRWRRCCAGSR